MIIFSMKILCETSMRHMHISESDFIAIFGAKEKMNIVKELSQPGQYLSDKRVTITGPKKSIENVAVLGPFREKTQVEVSRTDAFTLGINPPVRKSGDLVGAPKLKINDKIEVPAIIAQRHIHMNEEEAAELGLVERQLVSIKIDGVRGGVLNNVIACIDKSFALACHLDTDECNAMGNPKFVEVINEKGKPILMK